MTWFKRIKSWMRRPKRYWQIYWHIRRLKPKKIMEIGTWTGDRAVTMLRIASRYNEAKNITYYGFDLFDEMTHEMFAEEISRWPGTRKETYERIAKTGCNVELYQGDTIKILSEMVSRLPKMDLVFIDGGHSLETVASDWKYTSMLMDERTVVIFDDYWLNRKDGGCKILIDEMDRSKFKVKLLPITDVFDNTGFGKLVIKLAKVTLRK